MGTIPINLGETEQVGLRTLRSKTFVNGSQVRTVVNVAPLHYDTGNGLVDVDPTPMTLDGGITWQTTATPYLLRWDAQHIALTYTRRQSGDSVQVRLIAVDGVAFTGALAAPVQGDGTLRSRIALDCEIELRLRPNSVELVKFFHSAQAPTSLTWEIRDASQGAIAVRADTTTGRDNYGVLTRRPLEDRPRRSVELLHVRTGDASLYTVTETLTGRTIVVDPVTRAPSFVTGIIYPVEVDVTVDVTISQTDDDGYGFSPAYWNCTDTQVIIKSTKFGGLRFQSVNVPNGATLTSAILTIAVGFASGTGTSVVSGEASDSAIEWISHSANSPATMSATTANTSVPMPSVGTRTINVTTAAQEIVNRAGWAANNHMRFGWTNTAPLTGSNYWYFDDYNHAGTNQAQLEIIYTAGGAVTAAQEVGIFDQQLSGQLVGLVEN